LASGRRVAAGVASQVVPKMVVNEEEMRPEVFWHSIIINIISCDDLYKFHGSRHTQV
jgi:hypothetical protein